MEPNATEKNVYREPWSGRRVRLPRNNPLIAPHLRNNRRNAPPSAGPSRWNKRCLIDRREPK